MMDKTIDSIFEAAEFQFSTLRPSTWAEQNRFMHEGNSIEGLFCFSNSIYTKEILDTLSEDHPAQIIAVMKGSQLGFSTSVIENAIGFIIDQQPGNTLFLVGHDTVLNDAVKKIDIMIDNSGIRNKIKSVVKRARNTKSGDTDIKKEFQGGEIRFGIANHKTLRNLSMRFGFIDDYEAMRSSSKESGSTLSMILARFKSYDKKKKVYLISTPELKSNSNIEEAYLLGDQRKWHIPCPCCGDFITFEWEIDSKIIPNKKAGIYWKTDESGKLIDDSIGYICQSCDGFFTDKKKDDLVRSGKFIPTAVPFSPEYVSYHLPSLYAPHFMQGWKGYIQDYLLGLSNEKVMQVFVNQGLGLPYSPKANSIDSDEILKNIRSYDVCTVPESLSIRDGNGKIIMLTLGSDMNGTVDDDGNNYEDDARLDWEIVAWTENGSSYSIDHGSIGTFVPNEKPELKKKRQGKMSYKIGVENSVWPEYDALFDKIFVSDTGRKMKLVIGSLDSGYLSTTYAYPYLDSTNNPVIGIKGDKDETTGILKDADYRPFKESNERRKLWILNVNHIKDVVYTQLSLKWDEKKGLPQTAGFMNFPRPSNSKYQSDNFFSHFSSEEKVPGNNGRFVWKKKRSNIQNHMWDCRVYALAARDIFVHMLLREAKNPKGTWRDFVDLVLNSK